MYARYNRLLLRRPFATNMVTTGFLFGTGDFLAQKFFGDEKKDYDYHRTLRAVAYGGVIFAPIGDKWYKLLNSINVTKSAVGSTAIRVALDQLVFAPVVLIPMYYTVMTIFERKPVLDILPKLQQNLWPTLRSNWIVWPAFQAVNFSVVPVQFRLLAVNVISIGWNCYLSLVNNKDLHMTPEPLIE